jgi:tartrate-resistant acid phosphatase type 5
LYDVDIVLNSKLLIKAVMIDTQLICNEGSNKAEYLNKVGAKIKASANTTAPYFLVLGHYPVWSVGTKGPNACMINRVRPLLKKYNVNGYFCGDEHVMSHYTESSDMRMPIEYVISAASSSMFDETRNMKSVAPGYLRFHWRSNQSQKMNCHNCSGAVAIFQVNETQMLFRFVTTKNEEVYSFSIYPRLGLPIPEDDRPALYNVLFIVVFAEWAVVMIFVFCKLRKLEGCFYC